jgi:predicted nucleic acid-binding protein
MIVADASLLANLLIPGLDAPLAEAVMRRDHHWNSPLLWRYEVKNVLVKYIRAEGITEMIADNLMTRALRAMISENREAASSETIRTALEFRISSYDAEYVALARSLGVPLVTFDKKLARAAGGIACLPAEFIGRS